MYCMNLYQVYYVGCVDVSRPTELQQLVDIWKIVIFQVKLPKMSLVREIEYITVVLEKL